MAEEGITAKTKPVYEYKSGPETEVQFFNHLRVTQIGTDVYFDIGIIPADAHLRLIRERKSGVEVEFRVLKRYACSINTLAIVKRSINSIWNSINFPGFIDGSLRETETRRETVAKEKTERKEEK